MSTALAAKAYLRTALQSTPGLTGYTVTWSVPKVPPQAWIMLGKIAYQSSSWKTNRQYEEAYDIDLVVNAILPAGTAEEVETEVCRVQALAWAAITADPSLGGLVVTSVPASEHVVSWPSPTGAEGQASGRVSITARITR